MEERGVEERVNSSETGYRISNSEHKRGEDEKKERENKKKKRNNL